MPELLIELFSEEIPARMQGAAREALKKLVTDGLVEAGLTYESAGAFSTPRRLTLTIQGLTAESKPVREERKGPSALAGHSAIKGFLRSQGVDLDDQSAMAAVLAGSSSSPLYDYGDISAWFISSLSLGQPLVVGSVTFEARMNPKSQVATIFAVVEKPGRKAAEVVAEVLDRSIRNFPWPKSMRWGNGSLRWVRPLHSILCLLVDEGGAEVVPLTVEGITAGNTTGGHRFMAPARFPVSSFDDYAARLRRAFVMLDSAEREAHIWNDAQNQSFARGLEVVPDASLLAEVAGLVEWPVVLMGAIGADFLHLPPEVLQTSMREHQKFFSVKNPKTGRIEGFVTVANRETADNGATILKGNLKVLSARLSDARFFWDHDLRVAKAGMGEWQEGLRAVTFHNKLGSQADRIARIAALAREIAPLVGADADQAEKAAQIAKLDLRSAMVGEFPELQGTMGRYYALEAGEPEAIANAARDHYSPLGPSDAVPTEPVSVAVALADKIDTLTGFWAIDEKPTGSKDPFALRRAALGVIRLVLGNGVRFNSRSHFMAYIAEHLGYNEGDAEFLRQMYIQRGSDDVTRNRFAAEQMLAALPADWRDQIAQLEERKREAVLLRMEKVQTSLTGARDRSTDLLAFFHDRLKVFLRDQGIRHDVIDACLAMPGNDDLTLLVKRAEALQAFLGTEDGTNLLQGFKRANNILTQAEAKDGVEYSFGADPKFAETDEERALFAALDAGEAAIAPAMKAEDFAAAMAAMAKLRAPIDAFFTAVQINTDNQVVRRNRLNLLHRIRALVAQVADLTKVEG